MGVTGPATRRPLVPRRPGSRGWARAGVGTVVALTGVGIALHMARLLAGDATDGELLRPLLHLGSIIVLLAAGTVLVRLVCEPVVRVGGTGPWDAPPPATAGLDADRRRAVRRAARRGVLPDGAAGHDPEFLAALGRHLAERLAEAWYAGVALLLAGWLTLPALLRDRSGTGPLVLAGGALAVAVVLGLRVRRHRRAELRLEAQRHDHPSTAPRHHATTP